MKAFLTQTKFIKCSDSLAYCNSTIAEYEHKKGEEL